jgi:hypothetical protein
VEVDVTLGTGQWVRNRADEPGIAVINRFFESNPTNTKSQVALIERPALVQIINAGTGPGRRLFRQKGFCGGDLFHVTGTELYRHHISTTTRAITSTKITGTIQGTGAPDICATDTHLFITDGFTLQYTDGTAALATIDTSGIGSVAFSSIDVFDQFVICAVANSDKFYWLQPAATTFSALDFATAERFPDKILQVRVVGDEFWLLGEKSIEVWRATGDGTSPFQRIEGRAFNFGIYGGTAVRMKDTSVVVVADDGTVFNISGNPTVISNPAIAEATRDTILTTLGG